MTPYVCGSSVVHPQHAPDHDVPVLDAQPALQPCPLSVVTTWRLRGSINQSSSGHCPACGLPAIPCVTSCVASSMPVATCSHLRCAGAASAVYGGSRPLPASQGPCPLHAVPGAPPERRHAYSTAIRRRKAARRSPAYVHSGSVEVVPGELREAGGTPGSAADSGPGSPDCGAQLCAGKPCAMLEGEATTVCALEQGHGAQVAQ